MTLIPLNRKNFVHNQVEIRPTTDYVSASSFFNNFDEVTLEAPGTSGGIRAIGTYSPRVKEINKYYFELHPNNTNIGIANDELKKAQEESNSLSRASFVNDYLNKVSDLDVLCKNTWSFGIDRFQQRYMPYDINLHKKQTVKNCLYKDYLFYKGNDNVENPTWSFSNFNSINFFTIGKGDSEKTGFSDAVIHTNAIVYPNISKQYDFSNSDYTISFWFNPRYQQPAGQQKNNGCIINIPGLINIYQVKGTQKNIYDQEETFRIGVSLYSNTIRDIDYSDLDLSSNTNQLGLKAFITSDCLNYNHWHNIVVKVDKESTTTNVEIYVDKNQISTFTFQTVSFAIDNSFICIGNKIDLIDLTSDLTLKVNTLFANGSADAPYKQKFISVGDNQVPPANAYVDIPEIFSSNRSTSEALESEVHDIRIYSNLASQVKINSIYNRGISSVANENNLIFYVPVYFIPANIKKKTYINAAFLEEKRIADTCYNFVTNPYYFNNCGGHQLAPELFLLEWVKNSRPNIILGNRINNDYKDSIIEGLTLTYDPALESFRNSKKGVSYHEMYLSQSLTSNQQSVQTKSYLYNNHIIMPCDNGLQSQDFNVIKENFDSGIVTSSYLYKTDDNSYDYQKVSLQESFIQDIESPFYPLPLINENVNSFNQENILISTEDGSIDTITLFEDRVIERPHKDVLFNVSNANYHDFKNFGGVLGTKNRYDLDSFEYGKNDYYEESHRESNPIVRDYSDAEIDDSGNNILDVNIQKQFPLYKVTQDPIEYHSVIFSISNQLYNRRIRKETFSITDHDLFGTANAIKVNLKESGRGLLYRADALTKHADWNYIGHVFYSEGICTVLHPSLYNFGKTNFRAKFQSENAIFVNEVNIPLEAGLLNRSHNPTYDPELKASESAYEKDQKFVYVSEVNLHDENLNIVARAKLAQPVVKRETDNLVFRLKMDY